MKGPPFYFLERIADRLESMGFDLNHRVAVSDDELASFIYALCDPDTDEICYIGKANDPEWRRVQHSYEARRDMLKPRPSPKVRWVNELARAGKEPTLRILERVPRLRAADYERKWYRWALAQGCPLRNAVIM